MHSKLFDKDYDDIMKRAAALSISIEYQIAMISRNGGEVACKEVIAMMKSNAELMHSATEEWYDNNGEIFREYGALYIESIDDYEVQQCVKKLGGTPYIALFIPFYYEIDKEGINNYIHTWLAMSISLEEPPKPVAYKTITDSSTKERQIEAITNMMDSLRIKLAHL